MKRASGRLIVVMGLLTLGVLPVKALAGPAVAFQSEDFELGLGKKWAVGSDKFSVVDSSLAFSGDKYLNLTGPSATGGDSLLWETSSAGYENISVSGYMKIHAALELTDRLSLGWSVDGLTWQIPIILSGSPVNEWTPFSFDLPATADNNAQLTLRWLAEFDGASDRVLVDQLSLTGSPVSVPEPSLLSLFGVGLVACLSRRYLV
ncbi:MAG: PEP-CTERM sorting domain-containing protein [Patescibacteria group bacterium]